MTINYATGEITESPLSAMEASALTHAEAKIEQGLQTFVEVGQALAEIRDSRLYRESHSTFEDYCRDRWNLDRTRAYDIINAAETTVAVSEISDITPVNEGQAKALRGLDTPVAAKVMTDAHESTNGNVTAKAIRRSRQELLQNLSAEYVEKFPSLAFFRNRGEYERTNALGRDLDAMTDQERAFRLDILDKTIAHEKRKEAGETRPLRVVPEQPKLEPTLRPVKAEPLKPSFAFEVEKLLSAVYATADLAIDIEPSDLAELIKFSDTPAIEQAGRWLTELAEHIRSKS